MAMHGKGVGEQARELLLGLLNKQEYGIGLHHKVEAAIVMVLDIKRDGVTLTGRIVGTEACGGTGFMPARAE